VSGRDPQPIVECFCVRCTAALEVVVQLFAIAANRSSPPILWKNNVLLAQKVVCQTQRERLSDQALRVCCGAGKILASLWRFWAVAASKNSSFAPNGPRNRNRLRPRMRLRWAKSISTFFRSRIEMTYCLVLAISRATWRASSCSSRVIERKSIFGQHWFF
jgi:hypothetical protein